ncbi:unnamed protein product [Cochlearia groenlandica]
MLSLVSKQLRSLVTSPDLYTNRSLLGCTEQCVYALVVDTKTYVANLYSLNHITKRTRNTCNPVVENRLVRISSLPPMPQLASYVVVGSNIFVMGGYYDLSDKLSLVSLCIDCRNHEVRRVEDMPVPVLGNVSRVIDEKIYIVGIRPENEYPNSEPKTMIVFDSRTETWERGTKPVSKVEYRWLICFTWNCPQPNPQGEGNIIEYSNENYTEYVPRDWEMTDDITQFRMWKDECVMGDILYAYDGTSYVLRAYDLKEKLWGVVKGLEGKLPLGGTGSHIVRCGDNKLILFLVVKVDVSLKINKIWCAEIIVKMRQGREIWGQVLCCNLCLDGYFDIEECLVVQV